MQDKSKLGTRYSCFECGLKFYDLNRPDPLCPKCGADQRNNPNPDPREAVLARFKGKSAGKGGLRLDEPLEDEEESDEEVDADEPEELEDEDEEGGEEAGGGGEDED